MTACEPFAVAVPSPSGLTNVQRLWFSVADPNSSEVSDAGHALVVNVASGVVDWFPETSAERIWK